MHSCLPTVLNSDHTRRRASAHVAALLFALLPALGFSAEFSATLSPPPAGVTTARFTLWLPDSVTATPSPLRAIIATADYEAGKEIYRHRAWREFAARERCAVLLHLIQWDHPRFKLARGEIATVAFEQGLAQLANLSGRDDLCTVPWVLTGLSQSGWQAHALANLRPARTVAILPFHPSTGTHGPEDYLHAGTQDVPALLTMAGREVFPIEVLPFARTGALRGRPWTYLLQPGVPHHRIGPQEFPLQWLAAVFALRLAPDGTLRSIDPDTGWRADYSEYSPQPNDRRAHVVKIFAASSTSPDLRRGPLLWLPDEPTARAWQSAVQSRPTSSPP